MIELENVSKSFTLHNQGSAVIPVMERVNLAVAAGECVGLVGASGAGKSTLMRVIYGNYLAASGRVMVGDLDVAQAEPRQIIALRRDTLGYVSQFLRVVPGWRHSMWWPSRCWRLAPRLRPRGTRPPVCWQS